MKLLIAVLATLLLVGFTIETPESIREAKKAEKRWRKEVNRRFDLVALHQFLEATIKDNPTLYEIDLTKAKIGDSWSFDSMSMISGDWVFTYSSKENDFGFTYTYDDLKYIELKCRRNSKKDFHFIESDLGEWYILSAMIKAKPNQAAHTTPASRSATGLRAWL